MKIQISEQIPFRDEQWVIMQMVHKSVSIEAEQKEGETEEQLQDRVNNRLAVNLEIIASSIPYYKHKQARLNYILAEFKKIVSKKDYDTIIINAKKIKQEDIIKSTKK